MRTILCSLAALGSAAPLGAVPSMLLSPDNPAWNGWQVRAEVTAGFRENGGTGEEVTTVTRDLSITPGSPPLGTLTLPPAAVARVPLEGAPKDKAEGSLAFTWTTGDASGPDSFTFTIDSTTSAMAAKHSFGGGPRVPADAVFEVDLYLRTYAPLPAGNFLRVPGMPVLADPLTETMYATVTLGPSTEAMIPAYGPDIPPYPSYDHEVVTSAGHPFVYHLRYAIRTPYDSDPHITYTLSGGAGGIQRANVVPNPGFELGTASGTPVTTTAPAPGGTSAATSWVQGRVSGTFLETVRLPSNNTLGGSCGQMLRYRSDGVFTGSSANQVSVNLPVELPPGSKGGVDVNVVSGTLTAAFAVNLANATALDMVGAAVTGPTGGWKHLTFTNTDIASGSIQFQISAPPGDKAEVFFDNVTATTLEATRHSRYDYPEGFRPPQRWITNFCYPNQTPLVGDFDGDGLDDIATALHSHYAGQIGDVYVARNTGGAFTFAGKWHDNFSVANGDIPMVGDFDGDGRDDIACFVAATGGVQVALSHGAGFCGAMEWYPTETAGRFWNIGEVPLTGDFDGDGFCDIAVCTRGAAADIRVARNFGRGFAASALWHGDFCPGSAIPRAGDCNGDGKCDVVAFRRDAPGSHPSFPDISNAGLVEVALSNGTGFAYGDRSWWNFEFAPSTAHEPLLADLNGDGCMDIVAVHADGRVFAAVTHPDATFGTGPGGADTANPSWQWLSGLRANANEIPLAGRFDLDLNDDLCVFVRDQRSGDDFAATFVARCGLDTPARADRIDAVAASPVSTPGMPITLTGMFGAAWQDRIRLVGQDGQTLLTPKPLGGGDGTVTVAVPTGCWPSGLYRLVVFDYDASDPAPVLEKSTTSWGVRLMNGADAWQQEHFTAWMRADPAWSGDGADRDMDGLPNLGEYWFGTDPLKFDRPAYFEMNPVNGGFMALFTVRADRCVRVTLEESEDLTNWSPAPGGSSVLFPGEGYPGTTTSGFLPFSPVSSIHDRLFARLKFERR